VKKGTFGQMIKVLKGAKVKVHWNGGRNPKLSVEDSLLLTLMYWRESRTYFHIAQTYGISDSACWKTVRWVETALIQSGVFRLPGKKKLLEDGMDFEVVLIDATETPVERPKKNSGDTIQERKSGTR
jgi:hypothetical protein